MGEAGDSFPTKPMTSSVTIGSSLIPIINKLQDILAPVASGSELSKISLPQVAVVGSQSSGKSSVLEALVGRDFLPRGCDICTRRPLVLMLENRPPNSAQDAAQTEWGEFRHLPGKRFYDFTSIRREIQAETEREAGLNRGVSGKQIRLKITSPNVLNMTLVDLPGITKVPVGDQPSDIESRIRKMIMGHIRQENCIILAVTPANADLATSDALQLAREADPTGFRTIGVITKLDIMDRGTDASNFLLGKVVPLKLGYVGVVNRCQEDINKNLSIAAALAYEDKFFRNNPVYCSLCDSCGIPQLARKLNQILEHHIRIVLPGLKAELNSQMNAIYKELQTYGKVMESKTDLGATLLNILSKYCEAFTAMLDGKNPEMLTKELSGGARIQYIFQSIFVKRLQEVDPCDDVTDDDIRTAIQNASGARDGLFVPEVPFEVLVKRQIARLLDPSLQCLRFVYEELVKISHTCEVTELQRFPVLRMRLDEVMVNFLRDGAQPAERMIENLIEMEADYINTSHPNFLGGNRAAEIAMHELKSPQISLGVTDAEAQTSRVASAKNGQLPNQGSRSQLNNNKPVSGGSTRTWSLPSLFGNRTSSDGSLDSRSFGEQSLFGNRTSSDGSLDSRSFGEQNPSQSMPSVIQLREPPSILRPIEVTEHKAVEIVITKLLLRSYYDIVRKNIQDLVPKAIMHFLVNLTKRTLHRTFIQKFYRENLFEELLQEQDAFVLKRKHIQELLPVLEQSLQTLEKVEFDVSCRTSSFGTDASTELPRITRTSPPHQQHSTTTGCTANSFSYLLSISQNSCEGPSTKAIS
ncbi:dynamin-related protein 3A-like isoform X2 [Rosa rugosa]|uniref:dynamin-related protein 3A-like isoform X2 n=1 Tax=Rosa rugosa TaxID=74645 RepID=UPI002B4127DD|nr:dynamin-related protein 3A-like isoform X2 [Rosa rugosa]